MSNELFKKYGSDTEHMKNGIFASIFIAENKFNTACEKVQSEISMKQWLLIALLAACPNAKTLTELGSIMGCSRQNVKKLAVSLKDKGFIKLNAGVGNSVSIELTSKVGEYEKKMGIRMSNVLKILFEDFSEDEIKSLYSCYVKLYDGIERVENYANNLKASKEESKA